MSSNENSDSESNMGECSDQGNQYESEFTEKELESIVNRPQNGMTSLKVLTLLGAVVENV